MAWTKILLSGDAITELTGTAYRLLYVDSAGAVQELIHGTSGYFLKSQGASSDPMWDTPSVATLDAIGDVAAITEAQGQVLFRSATAWDALAPGTSGYFLKTQGATADPVWAAASVANIDDIGDVTITTPADDEVLSYEAGTWINKTAAEAGLMTDPLSSNSVGATAIDETATDITLNQLILTPKTVGTGTTEGTLFYDSDDDHLYIYVV